MAMRSEKKYAVLVKQLTTRADVEAGKMFGMPCVKVKGNVFVGLLKDDMFFKLSDKARVAARKIKEHDCSFTAEAAAR